MEISPAGLKMKGIPQSYPPPPKALQCPYQLPFSAATQPETLCNKIVEKSEEKMKQHVQVAMLATDGAQLSQRGKRILGHELAGLIERALN